MKGREGHKRAARGQKGEGAPSNSRSCGSTGGHQFVPESPRLVPLILSPVCQHSTIHLTVFVILTLSSFIITTASDRPVSQRQIHHRDGGYAYTLKSTTPRLPGEVTCSGVVSTDQQSADWPRWLVSQLSRYDHNGW